LTLEPDWEGRLLNLLLLAMAHRRLGHAAAAGEWWDQATTVMGDARPGQTAPTGLENVPPHWPAPYENVPSWSDQVEFELLRREAELLFGTEKQ
jgi:hypothetical protein